MERHTPEFDVSSEIRAPARIDTYIYSKATEEEDPQLAAVARRVHARSYRGEGFIYEDAVDENGEVVGEIDKSRGERVAYYVGRDSEGEPVSTLRTILSNPEKGGFRALPGYGICKDVINQDGLDFLDQAEAEGRRIVEISSFGHIPEVSARSGIEILRHTYQEAIGSGDVWYFSMVSQKLQTLVALFGPKAIKVVGSPVPLEDDRVGGVTLTPAIVDTTTFYDDIRDEIVSGGNTSRTSRHLTYLKIFTEGVEPDALSPEVRSLLDDRPREALASLAIRVGASAAPSEWSTPREFKLSNSIDRAYAERLIKEGVVRNVRGPILDEDSLLDGRSAPSDNDGSWFYFPWSASLIHYPEKDVYRSQRQARDLGLVAADEHARLRDQRPLYAGLSVGSHVLEHMVYAGVGDSHVLADFDVISTSNLNRIHAGAPDINEAKVDYFAKRVSELDPYVEQTLLREGITRDSLESLEDKPSIIFDEVDDFSAKVLLRQYAAENKIPLVMNTDVGYRSVVDIERHDLPGSRIFNGRLSQQAIDAMLEGRLTQEERMKITTKLIGLSNASFRLIEAVSDPGIKSFPQLEMTAGLGGILTTAAARDILLGRHVPSGRHTLDIRRSLNLVPETGMVDGVKILAKFLHKK